MVYFSFSFIHSPKSAFSVLNRTVCDLLCQRYSTMGYFTSLFKKQLLFLRISHFLLTVHLSFFLQIRSEVKEYYEMCALPSYRTLCFLLGHSICQVSTKTSLYLIKSHYLHAVAILLRADSSVFYYLFLYLECYALKLLLG